MPKRRRFIQARLADLRHGEPRLLPEPRSLLLNGPHNSVHEIDPSAVSELGIRVESRYVLARGTDGRPHLWLRRRRLSRPAGTGHHLAFDPLSPDFGGPAARLAAAFRLDLSLAEPVHSESGVTRVEATVSITNEDTRTLDEVVVYFQADRGGVLEPPVHVPAKLGPVEPAAALSALFRLVLLHDPAEPPRATVRALAIQSNNTRGIARLASADVSMAEARPAPDLRVELTGDLTAEGPIRRIPLVVRTDIPTDLSALEIQVRAQGPVRSRNVLALWRADGPSEGASDSIAGVASFNARQVERPLGLRAQVMSVLAPGHRISEIVTLDERNAIDSVSPSPLLKGKLEVRDMQASPSVINVLGVLTLSNSGELDFTDLEFVFEQGIPEGDIWRWYRVDHVCRDTNALLSAGATWAAPVIIHTQPARVAFLRALVRSPLWAIVEDIRLTQPVPLAYAAG